jgi:hypothetical protein
MHVCGFDPGLDTRIRGAAGPEKPSELCCTRRYWVIILLSIALSYFYAGARIAEFPCSLEFIPCAGKKNPCSVC